MAAVILKRSDYVVRTKKSIAMYHPEYFNKQSRLNYIKHVASVVKAEFPNKKANVNQIMTLGYYKSDIEEAVEKGFLKVVDTVGNTNK